MHGLHGDWPFYSLRSSCCGGSRSFREADDRLVPVRVDDGFGQKSLLHV